MNVRLQVNGRAFDLTVEPRTTLADALRDGCGLTGTNVGCEQGVCGACTVLVDGAPLRSCLLFAVQCEDVAVTTIEGLAGDGELTPLQDAFSRHHALQCGFCTPGFLLLATAVLEGDPDIGDEELTAVLSSNLCRCTGYAGIVAAVRECANRRR
jgi:carbon-monoxide dehydrogenase small subunit